jgi:hypothetical protein
LPHPPPHLLPELEVNHTRISSARGPMGFSRRCRRFATEEKALPVQLPTVCGRPLGSDRHGAIERVAHRRCAGYLGVQRLDVFG